MCNYNNKKYVLIYAVNIFCLFEQNPIPNTILKHKKNWFTYDLLIIFELNKLT